MRTKGMSHVGEFVPDNLIAGNRHPVDVCHVVIKEGQKLERGTVLEEDAAEAGKYVIRGTQAANTAAESDEAKDAETPPGDAGQGTEAQDIAVKAEYILAEAVDATEEDAVGAAYITGEFAENALIVKDGYTITDKDRKDLRDAGIFLRTIMM